MIILITTIIKITEILQTSAINLHQNIFSPCAPYSPFHNTRTSSFYKKKEKRRLSMHFPSLRCSLVFEHFYFLFFHIFSFISRPLPRLYFTSPSSSSKATPPYPGTPPPSAPASIDADSHVFNIVYIYGSGEGGG